VSDRTDLDVVDAAQGRSAAPSDGAPAAGRVRDEPEPSPGSGDDPVATSPTARVLAGLAVPGLDLDEARHLVGARARRRLRRRRGVLGGVGALCAVALAFVLWPRPDPDEIHADRDRSPSTTVTVAPATTSPVPEPTAPITTVPASSTTTPALTTVPVTAAPPPTLPANQALIATAWLTATRGGSEPSSHVRAGDTVYLRVRWSDPDVADASAVEVTADFRDPVVALPITGTDRPPCDQPGAGASGEVELPFRYSTPTERGPLRISVEITACDGAGAYGERHRIDLAVTVDPPPVDRRVVVVGGGDGRSPDAADVLDDTGSVLAERREPDLLQVLAADGATRATVAAVPAATTGPLVLRWGGICQQTVERLGPDTDAAAALSLQPNLVTCPDQAGAAGTGSSTRP
jgi:hypothetical protein